MRKIMTAALAAAVMVVLTFSSKAFADPEQSYQGGKAAAGLPKVDDRGFQERARDWLREKGREAGSDKKN